MHTDVNLDALSIPGASWSAGISWNFWRLGVLSVRESMWVYAHQEQLPYTMGLFAPVQRTIPRLLIPDPLYGCKQWFLMRYA